MSGRADILVKTNLGRPLALVEVKNLPQLSEGSAVDVLNDVVQSSADAIPYVMVVSQSAGFIWQLKRNDATGGLDYGKPQLLDMTPVFREYLTEAELGRYIRGANLNLVLVHWLGDLARGGSAVLPQTRGNGPFSQFVSDIRGAQVNLEALV
ncbi:MAG TPA: hypothetical protein VIM11_02875 [Tepidisphaeraceae bacterium]